jgi:hypothetical protein
MNETAVFHDKAGGTAPRCCGLRGSEPWILIIKYVSRIETAEKTTRDPA